MPARAVRRRKGCGGCRVGFTSLMTFLLRLPLAASLGESLSSSRPTPEFRHSPETPNPACACFVRAHVGSGGLGDKLERFVFYLSLAQRLQCTVVVDGGWAERPGLGHSGEDAYVAAADLLGVAETYFGTVAEADARYGPLRVLELPFADVEGKSEFAVGCGTLLNTSINSCDGYADGWCDFGPSYTALHEVLPRLRATGARRRCDARTGGDKGIYGTTPKGTRVAWHVRTGDICLHCRDRKLFQNTVETLQRALQPPAWSRDGRLQPAIARAAVTVVSQTPLPAALRSTLERAGRGVGRDFLFDFRADLSLLDAICLFLQADILITSGSSFPVFVAAFGSPVVLEEQRKEVAVVKNDMQRHFLGPEDGAVLLTDGVSALTTEELREAVRNRDADAQSIYSAVPTPARALSPRIYVFDDAPHPGTETLRSCEAVGGCPGWPVGELAAGTGGFGRSLGGPFYDTDQFSLEPIFHARVLALPSRVVRPDDADLYYIPFYPGLFLSQCAASLKAKNVTDKKSVDHCTRLGLADVGAFLEQQPAFARSGGSNFVLVLGRCLQWEFSAALPAVPQFRRVWLLGIETNCAGRSFSVPYPTGLHATSREQLELRQTALHSSADAPREHLACFVGTLQDGRNRMRTRMAEVCDAAGTPRCVRGDSADTALMGACDFCLQPHGDSRTRKSIWDGLLQGCVPVLFEESVLDDYRHYLAGDELVVLTPEHMRNGSFLDALAAVPRQRLAAMRRRAADAMPRYVYGGAGFAGGDAVDHALRGVWAELRTPATAFSRHLDRMSSAQRFRRHVDVRPSRAACAMARLADDRTTVNWWSAGGPHGRWPTG